MPEAAISTSNSSSRGSQRSTGSIWNAPPRSWTTAAAMRIGLFGRGEVGLGRALDRFGEVFRRLCTGHGDAAAEDEAGHAVDAGFLGRLRLLRHFRDVLVAGQGGAYVFGVEAEDR